MTTEPHTPSPSLTAGQQRRQASILLLRLQWVLILLLIIALFWLYISQQRFQNQVNERLQSNEQVVTRLNEMDDRLFAISQQTVPEPSSTNVASSQAQNQLDLLRVQIKAVDKLLADSDDKAAIDLLRGLHWQLSQRSNEIAPALTIVIKKSLNADIERLQAQSSQPSPWQLQNIAIQDIQEFLHSHERNNSDKQGKSHERTGNNQAKNTVATPNNQALTRRQLIIHEVIMTLNLAMQASNLHEQSQLTDYLTQARSQLQTITPSSQASEKSLKPSVTNTANAATSANKRADTDTVNNNANTIATVDTTTTIESPSSVAEVISGLDYLIANAPTPTPLLTTQILALPKS